MTHLNSCRCVHAKTDEVPNTTRCNGRSAHSALLTPSSHRSSPSDERSKK